MTHFSDSPLLTLEFSALCWVVNPGRFPLGPWPRSQGGEHENPRVDPGHNVPASVLLILSVQVQGGALKAFQLARRHRSSGTMTRMMLFTAPWQCLEAIFLDFQSIFDCVPLQFNEFCRFIPTLGLKHLRCS